MYLINYTQCRLVFALKSTPDPLPLRGVPRRGEGCNLSEAVKLEKTAESHPLPINRDDTSLKGGVI